MSYHNRDLAAYGSDLAAEYAAAVLATSPIAYWKMNEGTGTAIVDSSVNALTNGTYTGITWSSGSGRFGASVPLFDGVNDFGSVLSAALSSAIDLDEGFAFVWVKVDAAFWTDGANRYFLSFRIDSNNFVGFLKASVNNTLQYSRVGSGTTKFQQVAGFSYTNWFCVGVSWSIANDHFKMYVNGVQVGTTQTGNIAVTGSSLSIANIGAVTSTPAQPFAGRLESAVLYDTPVLSGSDARLALMI